RELRLPFPQRTTASTMSATPAEGAASSTPPHSATSGAANEGDVGRPKLWRRVFLVPTWLTLPLAFLGVAFIAFKPLGLDWYRYGTAIVLAIVIGVWAHSRYRTTVLRRGDQTAVVWMQRGKPWEMPPTSLPPLDSTETLPAPLHGQLHLD